ncbi:MAG: S41 family peptidase [Bacteroidales bacterium]|nr:S41 family peptidase [Bacteroidales bacterium]
MKRIVFFVCAAVAVACAAGCTKASKSYVNKAVKIMDKNGLYAVGDEWEKAKKEALEADPLTMEEAHSIVKEALKVAGGKHSFLKEAEVEVQEKTSEWEMPQVSITDSCGAKIAVVKLPQFAGNRDEGLKYAKTVIDAVPDDIQGVVIDIRGNGGGDMYPMISSVHRFIPEGDIISFRNRKGTMKISLDYVLMCTDVKQSSPIECPVAILTDEGTGSSAEALLLCFRGLEKARVFGSETAGYASSNMPYKMQDGSVVVLTIGCDVARTGEEFCDDPIQPDVQTDSPMEDAVAWITGQI